MSEKPEEEYRVKVVYTQDGKRILSEFWFDQQGRHHRLGDQPAIVEYDLNGDILDQHWLVHGKCHRFEKPAVIITDLREGRKTYQWHWEGKFHRAGGQPAFIVTDLEGKSIQREWYVLGKRVTKAGLEYKGPH